MTHSLRELLDADRDNLLDVVDWLGAMPQENFDKHVRMDLFDRLDPVAHDALRHRSNLERWDACLRVMLIDLQGQLADPARKKAEHAEWRKRAVNFHNAVLRRRAEADALLRQKQHAASAASALAANARRDAGERAIQRLKDQHQAEFVRFLAEEYEADGIPLPDRLYRHLRDHATATDDDADAASQNRGGQPR